MGYRKENVLAVILGVVLTIAVSFYTSFVVLNLLKEDEKYIETTLSFTEAVRLKESLDKLIKDYCEYMNKD